MRNSEGKGIFVGKDIFTDKGITIDFNGFTYTCNATVGSPGTENQAFHLEENNIITLANGSITVTEDCNAKFIIQNYSILTVSNMMLTGDKLVNNPYVFSNNNGIVTITDGTKITAPVGCVAFDVCSFQEYPGVTVTVDGATINGVIEISDYIKESEICKLELKSGDFTNAGFIDKSTGKKAEFVNTAKVDFGVAKIGDIGFASLVGAVNAAKDGNVIELQKNASGAGVFVGPGIFADKGITIDFNGFTYTCDGPAVGSKGTESQAFHLEKNNKITLLDGTVTATSDSGVKMLIQNYSDLTVTGMKLSDEGLPGTGKYVLSNNNGTVIIGEGTVITAKHGNVAFDVCKGTNYPAVNITVCGATIMGTIEIGGNVVTEGTCVLHLDSGVFDKASLSVITTGKMPEVTKDSGVVLAAPNGYEWEDNGLVLATYTITFELGGSEWIDGFKAPAEYTYGKGLALPDAENIDVYEKTGYTVTFLGWYIDGKEVTEIGKTDIGDKTVVAKYAETPNVYKVTFDLNGSMWAEGFKAPAEYTYGVGLALPDAENIDVYTGLGYTVTFDGWYLGDVKVTEIGKTDIGDKTVVAKYAETPNVYKISYELEEGSSIDGTAPETYVYGKGAVLPEKVNPYSKEGYTVTFYGWYLKGDVKETLVTEVTETDVEDKVFVAKYAETPNVYKVTFDLNGSLWAEGFKTPVEYTCGKGLVLPVAADLDIYGKTGYTVTFYGWYLKDDKSETPVTEIAGTDIGDKVFVAKYGETVNEYTVEFILDDGKVISEKLEYGAEVPVPEAPVKEGYKFMGWDSEIPKTVPAHDVVITAQWAVTEETLEKMFENATAPDAKPEDILNAKKEYDNASELGADYRDMADEINKAILEIDGISSVVEIPETSSGVSMPAGTELALIDNMTADDAEKIKSGEYVEYSINAVVSEEIPSAAIESLEKALGSSTKSVVSVEISIVKTVVTRSGETNKDNLSNLSQKVMIVFDLPDKTARNFALWHTHQNDDGSYSTNELEYEIVNGQVVAYADEFSTFSLAYDVKEPHHADTGVILSAALVVLIVLAIGTLAVGRKH